MNNWRINLILFFMFIFAAALIGRLAFLQIMQHDYYLAMAKGQQQFFITSQADRGEIFFQNRQLPVAINKTYFYLYASPAEIAFEDKEDISQTLGAITGLDSDFIFERLKKNSLYELIKHELDEEEAEKIKALNIKGIHFGQGIRRFYPHQDFASHVLGFVNKDGQGQYGAEAFWNEALWEGFDVTLTVDYNIQYYAERLLESACENLDAEGGSIIVIDPVSGKILSFAQIPRFNPNRYAEEEMQSFKMDAIQKVFEPGSAFKPITLAGAIDSGKVTPHTTYEDPGIIYIGGWPIRNYDHRIYPGQITMIEVLEKSINTGAVFAADQMGSEDFLDYIERFGIFEKTGVDLRGEVVPSNRELKQGREINFATASYGQGIEMTPLQLVRAFSAIANGGKLVHPYLAELSVDSQKSSGEQIISQKTAGQLTAMLVSTVEKGFAKAAKIPGYYIAGKTGTAQVSFAALGIDQRGYSEKTWQSFIGFAPAFDPQFLIIIKLDDPKTRTAEYSAVPIFSELAKYIINYWQIPPDYDE